MAAPGAVRELNQRSSGPHAVDASHSLIKKVLWWFNLTES
jgi:hypothetical protein